VWNGSLSSVSFEHQPARVRFVVVDGVVYALDDFDQETVGHREGVFATSCIAVYNVTYSAVCIGQKSEKERLDRSPSNAA
jgi:hypothetical protein